MSEKEIVVHICCAPCLIFPLKELRSQGFSVKGFFYNPNIYPQDEYSRRERVLKEYSISENCPVAYLKEDDEGYFKSMVSDPRRPFRCRQCWLMRLRKTAEYAKSVNIPVFTTTLLVSPYQDTEMLKEAGEQAARETGIDFYFSDFRIGYSESVRVSREKNIYRQKYCGCEYSLKAKKDHRAKSAVRQVNEYE